MFFNRWKKRTAENVVEESFRGFSLGQEGISLVLEEGHTRDEFLERLAGAFDQIDIDYRKIKEYTPETLFAKFVLGYLIAQVMHTDQRTGNFSLDYVLFNRSEDQVELGNGVSFDFKDMTRSLHLTSFFDIERFFELPNVYERRSDLLRLKEDVLPEALEDYFLLFGPIIKPIYDERQLIFETMVHSMDWQNSTGTLVSNYNQAQGVNYLIMPRISHGDFRELWWSRDEGSRLGHFQEVGLPLRDIIRIAYKINDSIDDPSSLNLTAQMLDISPIEIQREVQSVISQPRDYRVRLRNKLFGNSDIEPQKRYASRLPVTQNTTQLLDVLTKFEGLLYEHESMYARERGVESDLIDIALPMGLTAKDVLINLLVPGENHAIINDVGDNFMVTSVQDSIGRVIADPFYFFKMLGLSYNVPLAIDSALTYVISELNCRYKHRERLVEEMEVKSIKEPTRNNYWHTKELIPPVDKYYSPERFGETDDVVVESSIDNMHPFNFLVNMRALFHSAKHFFGYASKVSYGEDGQPFTQVEFDFKDKSVNTLELAYEYLMVFDILSEQFFYDTNSYGNNWYNLPPEYFNQFGSMIHELRAGIATVAANEFREWQSGLGRIGASSDVWEYWSKLANTQLKDGEIVPYKLGLERPQATSIDEVFRDFERQKVDIYSSTSKK